MRVLTPHELAAHDAEVECVLRALVCPTCGRGKQRPCVYPDSYRPRPQFSHIRRYEAAVEAGLLPLRSWPTLTERWVDALQEYIRGVPVGPSTPPREG